MYDEIVWNWCTPPISHGFSSTDTRQPIPFLNTFLDIELYIYIYIFIYVEIDNNRYRYADPLIFQWYFILPPSHVHSTAVFRLSMAQPTASHACPGVSSGGQVPKHSSRLSTSWAFARWDADWVMYIYIYMCMYIYIYSMIVYECLWYNGEMINLTVCYWIHGQWKVREFSY